MRNLVRGLALALVCLWVYYPCLHGTWLWDDGLEVAQNPMVRSAGGWWQAWVHPQGMDYFPLKGTFQWAEWHLWGDNPLGYHGASLALHVAGALLLWRLLFVLGVPAAFVGGLLFAVHPLAVESVAWISELKNTLSLPPLLMAAAAAARFDSGRRRRDQVLALLWFTAALLCKTSVVMLPLAILLLAWWRRGTIGARDLAASAPFFGAAAALGAVTVWFQTTRAIGIAGTPQPLLERLAQAGWSISEYARQFAWPSGLSPVYPPGPSGWVALLPWLGLAAVLGALWALRSGWGRHGLLGAGWYLANLAPVLGLVPMAYSRVSPRADHLVYLPMAGLAGLAAAALGSAQRRIAARAAGSPAARLPLAVAAGLALGALALESHSLAARYVDGRALWSFAVERNPGAWLARNNLGREFLQEGRAGAAEEQFRAAVAARPDSPEAHANLGNALEAQGRDAEARAEYGAALAINPGFAGAHYDLGLALLRARSMAAAAAQFEEAVRLDPGHAQARNALGLALAGEGRLDEAMARYEEAVRLDPGLPEAHLNLGNALFRKGRTLDAVGEYREAIRLQPGYAGAHFNLGQALLSLGRPDEARSELEAARGAANH
jgi:tetratricopeptide (TPR) repeat protein